MKHSYCCLYLVSQTTCSHPKYLVCVAHEWHQPGPSRSCKLCSDRNSTVRRCAIESTVIFLSGLSSGGLTGRKARYNWISCVPPSTKNNSYRYALVVGQLTCDTRTSWHRRSLTLHILLDMGIRRSTCRNRDRQRGTCQGTAFTKSLSSDVLDEYKNRP